MHKATQSEGDDSSNRIRMQKKMEILKLKTQQENGSAQGWGGRDTHVLAQTTEWEQIVGTLKTKPRIHTHTQQYEKDIGKDTLGTCPGIRRGIQFCQSAAPRNGNVSTSTKHKAHRKRSRQSPKLHQPTRCNAQLETTTESGREREPHSRGEQ